MKTILIMEDAPYHARLMRKMLENDGFAVLHAPTGEEGLRMALEYEPDLILLDMGLPDLDGQTVAGLAKGSSALCTIPLIAVTAWPQETARQMAQAYGCEGYISKPIQVRQFAAQVRTFLQELGTPD